MKFRYKDYFKTEPSTGYETLIYDCMIGDKHPVFSVPTAWKPAWAGGANRFPRCLEEGRLPRGLKVYEPRAVEGPEEANELVERDGRKLAEGSAERWQPTTIDT